MKSDRRTPLAIKAVGAAVNGPRAGWQPVFSTVAHSTDGLRSTPTESHQPCGHCGSQGNEAIPTSCGHCHSQQRAHRLGRTVLLELARRPGTTRSASRT